MATSINEGGVWIAPRRTGQAAGRWGEVGAWMLVSPEDVEFVKARRWTKHTKGYLKFSPPHSGPVHRAILSRMGVDLTGKFGDHINGIECDNRRENLRAATFRENLQNQRVRKGNTSGYRGVNFNKRAHRYIARVANPSTGKREFIGYFDTAEQAHEAVEKRSLEVVPFYVKGRK